jgi:LPXTG-site transpeptidase (sortase) family protein
MQHEKEPVKEGGIQRRERGWGRKGEEKKATGAAYVAAPHFPLNQTNPDRFRPGRLRPVDEPREQRGPRPTRPRLPGWLRPETALDRVLLAVEIAGALVVAWVVWQYLYTTYFDTAPRRLTPARTATATALPGVLPTATRFVEVLPPIEGGPESDPPTGGPPGTTGVPTPSPTPTVAPELLLPNRLRIPAMVLDSPVHEVRMNMEEWEVSPMEVGHHEGTGVPGQAGNVVLAAHRDVNSALFRELDRLGPGDEVFVSNALGEYRYVVSDVMEVSPEHVEVMYPSDDTRVTLITCTPPGIATRRLVVVAHMADDGATGRR